MAKTKIDVVGPGTDAHRVERFDVARLLEIAHRYSEDRPAAGEFATSWFAAKKGWTYERALKTLRLMEADGLVVSRPVGKRTLWRVRE